MSISETYTTPEPISASIEIEVGNAKIVTGKRADTTVVVRPADGTKDADVKAAEQTKVDYSGGRLTVRGPKTKKRSLFGSPGAIEVVVELPVGSQVSGGAAVGAFLCEGELGECRIKVATGDIQIEHAGTAHLGTSHGDILVDRVSGNAELSGSGRLRVGEITGTATIANSNGEITLHEVVGELRAKTANGAIAIGRAHAGLNARTANGSIRIDEVARGQVVLETGAGNIDIGIRKSTTAWLDVQSKFGRVRQLLDETEGPATSEETIEVRARSGVGDITVRRATAA
ncbi:DUF4097 family beta strand repeat-containing protein (plasmid) [Streptomyces sp. NBC_01136]|uniref:DUF4097 family beta strand repeat-containing protein n=1 Tax=unclassified Streptomyces TaxID=2593676 RepID=UPI002F91629F|nr:DUF4097 family beta strand repeat-containing protein [Streptomyces sp. NBC_01136]